MSLTFTSATGETQTDDSHGIGSISEINIDDRIRFHRAALTDAAKGAALLVATLRPAPSTWPQDSASKRTSAEDGGCGWARC